MKENLNRLFKYSLTELSDSLVDCHIVRDHVIVDQKLELVSNAISLVH